jgi:hypothetical protein
MVEIELEMLTPPREKQGEIFDQFVGLAKSFGAADAQMTNRDNRWLLRAKFSSPDDAAFLMSFLARAARKSHVASA